MKISKRALISMIVVSTVFCLILINNIKLPTQSKEGKNSTKDVSPTNTTSLKTGTEEDKIRLFSDQVDESSAFRLAENLPAQEVTVVPQDLNSYQDRDLAIEVNAAKEDSAGADTFPEKQAQSEGNIEESDDMTKPMEDGDKSAFEGSSDTTKDTENTNGNHVTTETSSEITPTAADVDVEKVPEAKYANVGISIAKDYVNIRKEPSTDAEILGKLYRDSAAYILEKKDDDWYYVESGSVKGYVKAEYIKTGIPDDELIEKYGTLTATVDVDGLNVREDTSTESKRLTVIYMNERYPVVEIKDDWVKINIEDDNIIGNVKSEFVEIEVTFKEAISKEEEQKLLQLQAQERAKKETEIKYGDGYSYSKDDIKLLACLIHAEAGTQSYEGKLAVANVVLNRVKSSKYPDTIKAVIYQSGQFSVAKSGSLQKQLDKYHNYSSKSQLLSIKAAKAALEGANNIGNRLYFHSYKAAAKKGYTSKSTSVKIGDHLFW